MLGNIQPERERPTPPAHNPEDKHRVMQMLHYNGSQNTSSATQLRKAKREAVEKFLETVAHIPYWNDPRGKLPGLWKKHGDSQFDLEPESKERTV